MWELLSFALGILTCYLLNQLCSQCESCFPFLSHSIAASNIGVKKEEGEKEIYTVKWLKINCKSYMTEIMVLPNKYIPYNWGSNTF